MQNRKGKNQMQRLKTKEEILDSQFVSKADIKKLFGIGSERANKIYKLADEIDNADLKYRIFDNRVRITSMCKVVGISINLLQKQIKSVS